MSEAIARLNAALQGRYAIERDTMRSWDPSSHGMGRAPAWDLC